MNQYDSSGRKREAAGSVRRVYGSVDEMLSAAVMTELEGRPVAGVRLLPFHSSDGKSGSHFKTVDLGNGRPYILKRIASGWDWVMRASGDTCCRPVLAWRTGLLDRLPHVIDHGTVACAVDGDGWAILMRDFRGAMIPPGDVPIGEDENAAFLDAMADLHARFWDMPDAAPAEEGFCDLRRRYAFFSPEVMRPEAAGGDIVPGLVVQGWEILPSLIDSSLARAIADLHEDVGPLVSGLLRGPQTVVHGDWKLGNLGLLRRDQQMKGTTCPGETERQEAGRGGLVGESGPRGEGSRVVLLDWALTGPGPAAADLGWYLALNSARLPVSKEACIELYRDSLSRRLMDRFVSGWWVQQLDLCLLGALVLFGWEKSLGAAEGPTEQVRARERRELDWWAERAAAGVRRLGVLEQGVRRGA